MRMYIQTYIIQYNLYLCPVNKFKFIIFSILSYSLNDSSLRVLLKHKKKMKKMLMIDSLSIISINSIF